jgi:hypothetical protein
VTTPLGAVDGRRRVIGSLPQCMLGSDEHKGDDAAGAWCGGASREAGWGTRGTPA